MSTESETKSAGVPAGATHRCAVEGCGIYYRQIAPFHYVTVPRRGRACTHFLRPIAEAGPAPTTAAPAEQLSGKVETTFAWLAEHRPPGATREPCYGGEDANGVAFHTADHNAAKRFPTKAAAEAWITERIPREGFKAVEHGWFGSPAEQPGKAADPRPAQPQAPAEPWRSPEGYTLVELLEQQAAFASGEGHMLSESELRAAAEHFREHPPEVAAPLREERDRLAAANRSYAEEVAKLREDQRIVCAQADTAEAKVAERDARIVQMRTELESAASALDDAAEALEAKWQHPGLCSGQDAERLSKVGFWAGIGEVMAHTMRAARRVRRAALGAPEGQRPAAPSEAPRHCRICEEPMSDTCEECQ